MTISMGLEAFAHIVSTEKERKFGTMLRSRVVVATFSGLLSGPTPEGSWTASSVALEAWITTTRERPR